MIDSGVFAKDRFSRHLSSRTMYRDTPVMSKNRLISVFHIVPHDGIWRLRLADRPLNADCIAYVRIDSWLQ
jgi:hypothetical protein